MPRPKKPEPTEQIRVPQSVARRIRRAAAHLDEDPGDYIVRRLLPHIERDEARMLSDLEREKKDRTSDG